MYVIALNRDIESNPLNSSPGPLPPQGKKLLSPISTIRTMSQSPRRLNPPVNYKRTPYPFSPHTPSITWKDGNLLQCPGCVVMMHQYIYIAIAKLLNGCLSGLRGIIVDNFLSRTISHHTPPPTIQTWRRHHHQRTFFISLQLLLAQYGPLIHFTSNNSRSASLTYPQVRPWRICSPGESCLATSSNALEWDKPAEE